jgi:hypothetical protein
VSQDNVARWRKRFTRKHDVGGTGRFFSNIPQSIQQLDCFITDEARLFQRVNQLHAIGEFSGDKAGSATGSAATKVMQGSS